MQLFIIPLQFFVVPELPLMLQPVLWLGHQMFLVRFLSRASSNYNGCRTNSELIDVNYF